jgi:hypothetical protein
MCRTPDIGGRLVRAWLSPWQVKVLGNEQMQKRDVPGASGKR